MSPVPVFVDVGASDAPPEIWRGLAPFVHYVGFDPDSRELHEPAGTPFARATMVNEAVTDRADVASVTFHLTRSPFCSSVLMPDAESLAAYLFADLFTVERSVTVPAATLAAIADRLRLASVDWLKVDSQGTDLRIFAGLGEARAARLLALDIEPGLIDAYHGEDHFVDAHRELMRRGFWLAACTVKETLRMQRATFARLQELRPDLDERTVRHTFGSAPGWCEARYLRTIASMRDAELGEREYALAWVIAMACGQLGHATDLAFAYRDQFGDDPVARGMWGEIEYVVAARRSAMRRRRLLSLPGRVLRRMRRGR